jgi:hypothetical protein
MGRRALLTESTPVSFQTSAWAAECPTTFAPAASTNQRILDDGRRIGVINTYPRFFDISFVFIGADKTAKMMCKLASGLWVPSSVAEGEELYGVEEGELLVKSATIQVPRNLYIVDSAGKDYGRTDDGSPATTRAVKDGRLQTNDQDNEAEEGTNVNSMNPSKTAGAPLPSVIGGLAGGLAGGTAGALSAEEGNRLSRGALGALAGAGLGATAGVGTAHLGDLLLPALYKRLSPGLRKHRALTKRYREDDAILMKLYRGKLGKNKRAIEDLEKEMDSIHAVRKKLIGGVDRNMGTAADVGWHGGGALGGLAGGGASGLAVGKPWKEADKKKTAAVHIGPPPKPNRKEYPFVGSINFRGLMIHVENKPGDVREGKGPNGKKWRTHMQLPYGEFVGTRGVDEDKLDVYVGPNRNADNVYIIHQNFVRGPNKGKYDEDKVMVGFESAEQAKAAYLAHYDSPKYFRSITTMAFPLFKKAIQRKEVHGEKVAAEMKKIAQDFRLEDLFTNHKTARRREKTWKTNGKENKVIGSGFESSDMAKAASAEPEPFTAAELLKMAAGPKTASQLKWAEIVKRIGPSRAVGRVSPLLSANEPSIPKDVLNEMGKGGLEKGLSTASLMGMVLKPREFQRACLCSMGKEPLADKLDDAEAVFKPTDGEMAPCSELDSKHFGTELMKKLIPLMMGKSYFGPPVKRRILRITIVQPAPAGKDLEVDSPLLTKVSSAYNWYRREQMKLAADAMTFVPNNPELHAALYGLSMEDLFSKSAGVTEHINPATVALVAGSIPLTLMYAAHQQNRQRRGDDVGTIDRLVADHPWLTTMSVGVGLRQLMKSPQVKQAVEEALAAGKRILHASAGT